MLGGILIAVLAGTEGQAAIRADYEPAIGSAGRTALQVRV